MREPPPTPGEPGQLANTGPTGEWLSALPDAVAVVDANGLLGYLNPEAARLLGAPVATLIGRPFDEAVQLVDAGGRGWWTCTHRLRAMRGVRGVPARTLRCLAGGRERPFVLRATFRRDRAGQLLDAVCVLREPAAGPGPGILDPEVLSALAHDLRAPLTGIAGFGTTLRDRWDRFDDAQRQELVGTIVAESARLGRMVRELVEAIRVEAGALPRRRAPVEVERLVRTAIDRVAPGPHPIEVATRGTAGQLSADAERLAQALADLVEHAAAVSRQPGPIQLEVDGEPEAVVLVVRSTGPPLEPKEAAGLFALRGRKAPHGTGLGLFVAKGVIEDHGGRVRLLPGTTGGTAVRVELPRGGSDRAGGGRHPGAPAGASR